MHLYILGAYRSRASAVLLTKKHYRFSLMRTQYRTSIHKFGLFEDPKECFGDEGVCSFWGMTPLRIRHCRHPHPQSTPEQTREKTPLIRSRTKLRLMMLIKPSFHQRSRNTTRLCVPCSDPSSTKSACRSVPCPDVVTGWAEGNRSLTPVPVTIPHICSPSPSLSASWPPPLFKFTLEPLFFFSMSLTHTCTHVHWL